MVLGLARGGIPVAWEVAAALDAPLDVFAVRKLGVPQWPELALGAIASGGAQVVNERVVTDAGVTPAQLREIVDRETVELVRRETVYRGGRDRVDVDSSVVLLVDDGVATGASMRVALQAVRTLRPNRVVAAVPVGPLRLAGMLPEADDVVCAVVPPRFEAVGQVYADFTQVGDDEVRELLHTSTTS